MSKILQFKSEKNWSIIRDSDKSEIERLCNELHLTYQDIKQLIDISLDLKSWDERNLSSFLPITKPNLKNRELKVHILNGIKESWELLKKNETDYSTFQPTTDNSKQNINFIESDKERTILGDCPVASDKTRCCNLKTLDSVINCGFDCSYCTIQSFYKDGKVIFEKNLKEKLDKLSLDPLKKYHIGTGQSSDSLMWGNKGDNLKNLFDFARNNPNVILELKTKSANIDYLLNNRIPPNVICTWSLNTQTVIDKEEHLTASLNDRITAAKLVSKSGILVGFHFHPMVYYKGWEDEYASIAKSLVINFKPESVALVSIGTLTFIKPVIKQIRERDFKTKILQIPLSDAEGKFSYDYETKKLMFSKLFHYFEPWHNKVFFYMCMEDKKLWKDVFNREYKSNTEFEEDMINSYFNKIGNR